MWRRIVVGAMTTLMLAMIASKSFEVETIPVGTIPPLTESLPSSPSPFPPGLISLLILPSPSPLPLSSPSPSPIGSPSPSPSSSHSTLPSPSISPSPTPSPSPSPSPSVSVSPSPSLVYKISGRVTNGGEPVAGVKVKIEGSRATSTTTDGSGYYAFNELRAGGNYTITPAMARMNFTPQNHSFNGLTQNGSADFSGLREPDTKSISKCNEADENRERKNIRDFYEGRWLNSIRDERLKIIANIVHDGEVAEATLRPLEAEISFFEECKGAYVTVRYGWQINTFFNGKPARVLNVPKQRRFICGKIMGGWFCKSI